MTSFISGFDALNFDDKIGQYPGFAIFKLIIYINLFRNDKISKQLNFEKHQEKKKIMCKNWNPFITCGK